VSGIRSFVVRQSSVLFEIGRRVMMYVYKMVMVGHLRGCRRCAGCCAFGCCNASVAVCFCVIIMIVVIVLLNCLGQSTWEPHSYSGVTVGVGVERNCWGIMRMAFGI